MAQTYTYQLSSEMIIYIHDGKNITCFLKSIIALNY